MGTRLVSLIVVCRYLSEIAFSTSSDTALRALRAVSRETWYSAARAFSCMLLNSAQVSRPCRILFVIAVVTRSSFVGLRPRRFKLASIGLLETALDFGVTSPGVKLLGESLHHDGGGI